jgi:hypothetical protein
MGLWVYFVLTVLIALSAFGFSITMFVILPFGVDETRIYYFLNCVVMISILMAVFSLYSTYKTFRMSALLITYINELTIQFRGTIYLAFIAIVIQMLSSISFVIAVCYWLDFSDNWLYPVLIFLVILN